MIKPIVRRLRAKTPRIYRRIRNLSLAISGASTAAAVFYSSLPADVIAVIPDWFIKVFALAGIAAAFLAQLTKEKEVEK